MTARMGTIYDLERAPASIADMSAVWYAAQDFATEWRKWRDSGYSVSDGVIKTADVIVAKVFGP